MQSNLTHRFRVISAALSLGILASILWASPGSPDQSSLSGIYRAATDSCASQIGITDPTPKTPGFCYLTFFADGLVRKGLPTTGLDGFIEESQARLDTASGVVAKRGGLIYIWGRYAVSGEQGQIQWLDRNSPTAVLDTIIVKHYPSTLVIQGATYVLLQSGDGMKLQGTFKPFGDPKEKGITFTSDGEFIDEGILNYGATAVGAGNVAMAFEPPNGGRGTYDLDNYTLTLNFANSTPAALFYVLPGSSGTHVSTIYINNVKYVRVK